MHGIEAELQHINAGLKDRDWLGNGVYRPTKTVWFQAWKYAEEDAILAAFSKPFYYGTQRYICVY
ncbi:MAG: hypothetical protein GKS05_02460 [Nitrospirales bacterium]|nr:hypothetical protein [Nitrospirales bacterium]